MIGEDLGGAIFEDVAVVGVAILCDKSDDSHNSCFPMDFSRYNVHNLLDIDASDCPLCLCDYITLM